MSEILQFLGYFGCFGMVWPLFLLVWVVGGLVVGLPFVLIFVVLGIDTSAGAGRTLEIICQLIIFSWPIWLPSFIKRLRK